MERLSLQLKIVDLDSFRNLVEALGSWAEEVSRREKMTAAEQALFDAAVKADRATQES